MAKAKEYFRASGAFCRNVEGRRQRRQHPGAPDQESIVPLRHHAGRQERIGLLVDAP